MNHRSFLVSGIVLAQFGAVVALGAISASSADHTEGRVELKKFRPATYKGLRFGSSRRADVDRLFGPPATAAMGEDGNLYLYYRDVGVVPGKI